MRAENEIKATWLQPELPLVSVCCITYNHEKYIAEAIESFLNQETNFAFEIIVGEDCSTDQTAAIIERYRTNYPSIISIVTSEDNVGPQINFERVIKAAKGKYIAFCEGDDYFLINNKLALNTKQMEDDCSLSFIFGPALQLDEVNGGRSIRNRYTQHIINGINIDWVLKRGGAFYPTPTCFYKKSNLDEKPYWFDLHCTGDYPVAIMAVLNGKIGYTDTVTACYRKNGESFSNKIFINKVEGKENTLNKYKQNIRFLEAIFNEGIVNITMYKFLIAKEDYVYYAKLLDCGYGLSVLQGIFKIRYSLTFKARLLAKFFYKLFN